MKFINQVEPYITNREAGAVARYLGSGGWMTEFNKSREFEDMLCRFTGSRHAAVVTSGTAALYLSLLAAGIGPGDRVMVPNYTMIATANAVKWTGAEPELVDVEPSTLCMDLEKAARSAPCKAMIYVSINGRSRDMREVAGFCSARGMTLIEDACQSLGSRSGGRALGSFGDLGVFSFTPHKIVTTGQGGAVVTDDDETYRKILKLKDFHRTAPATDRHDGLGFNFKFTDLQAVVGIEQMRTAEFRVRRKREIFHRYRSALEGTREAEFLKTPREVTPWFVDLLLPSEKARDSLIGYLKRHNVGTRPFYPPLNHQPLYGSYPRGSFPVSEEIASRGVWLPSSIGLEDARVDYVCEKIKNFFGGGDGRH